MKILTFDTSLEKMYITISEGGSILDSRIIENTKERYHSALLIPTIIELLQKFNLTMQDINCIGVNKGPGSFTGIRASCVVARVLGQNLNIPVVGISSLEILSCSNKNNKPSLILLDARKGKAYTALYSEKELLTPRTMEYEKAFEYAKNNDFDVITDKRLASKLSDEGISYIQFENLEDDFGEYLAQLTYKYIQNSNKKDFNWVKLKPLYIQPPPISMPKVKK